MSAESSASMGLAWLRMDMPEVGATGPRARGRPPLLPGVADTSLPERRERRGAGERGREPGPGAPPGAARQAVFLIRTGESARRRGLFRFPAQRRDPEASRPPKVLLHAACLLPCPRQARVT